ncbi:MAG: hypothetical protein KDA60_14465, partial [Planctomycetales bacterium]|nr:hypothetical protein [Planctomycetales bacterium]
AGELEELVGQTAGNREELRTARSELLTRPAPFVYRPLVHGRIFVFGDDPFPGTMRDWQWFFRTMSESQLLWYRRHGLSLRRENPDYWDFLIPGVGLAPINGFRIMITMFVIAIGPLNFILLRKIKRLNWILITVPVGAALIILGLFVYAVTKDGLGVQSRNRSITHIDQRNNRAVTWSRQSYYAGIAPSQGFHFAKDAAVYPIDQRPTGRRSSVSTRAISWGDEQHLERGFLSPRVTSQFLMLRSHPSQIGLEVRDAGDGKPPVVVNHLSTSIERLYLCAADGQLYMSQTCNEGETASLSPTTVEEIRNELEALYDSTPLEPPDEFDGEGYRRAMSMSSTNYSWYAAGDANLSAASQLSGKLEGRLGGMRRDIRRELGRRSYLAIVSEPPDMLLGVERTTPRQSLSIVTGEW